VHRRSDTERNHKEKKPQRERSFSVGQEMMLPKRERVDKRVRANLHENGIEVKETRMTCLSCFLLQERKGIPVCGKTNTTIPAGLMGHPRKKAKGEMGCTLPPLKTGAGQPSESTSAGPEPDEILAHEDQATRECDRHVAAAAVADTPGSEQTTPGGRELSLSFGTRDDCSQQV